MKNRQTSCQLLDVGMGVAHFKMQGNDQIYKMTLIPHIYHMTCQGEGGFNVSFEFTINAYYTCSKSKYREEISALPPNFG